MMFSLVSFPFVSAVALGIIMCVARAAAGGLRGPPDDYVRFLPDYGVMQSDYYAGYLNATAGSKAFYVFIESSGDPMRDPMVLWLNGGPGCSSLVGLFEENGPYIIRHGGRFTANEYNWTQLANILYIESPGGVGFSTTNANAWGDRSTMEYNFAAVQSFYKKFPIFARQKLYLTGESYAGFYIPELAHHIMHSNDTMLKRVMQGFMVGNPCTGDIGCESYDPTLKPYLQYNGFWPLDDNVRNTLNTARYDPYDLLVPTCESAAIANRVRFNHPIVNAFKKKMTGAPAPYGPCASEHLTKWLNRDDVKAALHVNTMVSQPWTMCADVNYNVNFVGVVNLYQDMMDHSNYKILVYSGLDDSIVNQAQTQTTIIGMNRTLKYNQFKPWYRPDVYRAKSLPQLGGFYLEYDRLSWAGVRNSGHMVPQFNPPAALELFRSYLTLGRPGRLH